MTRSRMGELLLKAAKVTDEGSSLTKLIEEENLPFDEMLSLCSTIAVVLRGYVNSPTFVKILIRLLSVDDPLLDPETVADHVFRYELRKKAKGGTT